MAGWASVWHWRKLWWKCTAVRWKSTVPVLGTAASLLRACPSLTETAKPPLEPTSSHPKPVAPRRILVVDDNRDSAESLTALLKLNGHETHTAFDGIEAIEAAATFRPDVVLLDIGLPKLNGYETARRMREQPWSNGMVLVAVTGWGQEEDRQKTREAGFDAHLVKPIDFAALTKLLAAAGTSAATEGSIS